MGDSRQYQIRNIGLAVGIVAAGFGVWTSDPVQEKLAEWGEELRLDELSDAIVPPKEGKSKGHKYVIDGKPVTIYEKIGENKLVVNLDDTHIFHSKKWTGKRPKSGQTRQLHSLEVHTRNGWKLYERDSVPKGAQEFYGRLILKIAEDKQQHDQQLQSDLEAQFSQ